MIRKYIVLFFISLAILFYSCKGPDDKNDEIMKGRHIIPGGSEDIVFSSYEEGKGNPKADVTSDSFFPLIKVSLPDSYIPVYVVNDDIDMDQNEEQLIAVKKKGDQTDSIYLIAVDYSEVRGGFMKVWEEKIGVTNVRTLNIIFDDVSGDHIKEIICMGLNEEGEQVLNIFRRSNAPLAFSISFEIAADIVCDGTIEIEKRERSSSYESGYSDGASYPIITYSKHPDGGDDQDLLMTTYMWKLQENGYVKVREERIPGANIVEETIRELSRGDKDKIESFISGPWYRSTGGDTESEDILIFDLKQRKITFYSTDRQENYNWNSSYKRKNSPYGPGLDLLIRNQTMETKVKGATLTILSTDSLALNLYNTDEWDGTYRRLTENLQKVIIEKYRDEVALSQIELDGLYKNKNGYEFFFAEPRYTYRSPHSISSGGYVLYNFGGYNVLELVEIGENGLIKDRYTYVLSLDISEDNQRVVKRIELIPAQVSARQVSLIHGNTIKMEQIEEKNSTAD
jgi:hypothetical protein